ncbi:putative NADPH--hemoprotein reductase [Helianthus annuus]|nr:putative NADPH--hemoprotein reductase [Helianthus annuus]
MQSETVEMTPFVMLNNKVMDNKNSSMPVTLTMLLENQLLVLMTSAAVLLGFITVFVWNRSSGKKFGKELEPRKTVVLKRHVEQEVDDGVGGGRG